MVRRQPETARLHGRLEQTMLCPARRKRGRAASGKEARPVTRAHSERSSCETRPSSAAGAHGVLTVGFAPGPIDGCGSEADDLDGVAGLAQFDCLGLSL